MPNQLRRRNERGSKAKDLNNFKDVDISELSGPFKAQEYLHSLIRSPAPVADIIATPKGINANLW